MRRLPCRPYSSVGVPPCFAVNAASVRPLSTPREFYDVLLSGCRLAQRRVTLASLYLGTGSLERDLVSALVRRCLETHATGQQVEVAMQFDLNRGLRRVPSEPGASPASQYASSAHLALEVLRGAPDPARVHAGLTLMPQQRGLLGRLLPPRLVEVLGVFHIKAYVFDSTVVLSGANLSTDYFSSRQDRYVLLEDVPGLAAYLHALVDGIRELPGAHTLLPSGQVGYYGADGLLTAPKEATGPIARRHDGALNATALPSVTFAPLRDAHLNARFAKGLGAHLARFSDSALLADVANLDLVPPSVMHAPSPSQALVSPRLQCGAVGIRVDEQETLRLLGSLGPALMPLPTSCSRGSEPPSAGDADQGKATRAWRDVCFIASGYFNLPGVFRDAILARSPPFLRSSDLVGTVQPASAFASSSSSVHILTASPKANGFFGARGISGAIPNIYGEALRRFYCQARESGRLMGASFWRLRGSHESRVAHGPGIALYEYDRPGWTFHGKGLWLLRRSGGPGEPPRVSLTTLIGSPNFGQRSVYRDAELQLELRTQDSALVQRFAAECDGLFGTVVPLTHAESNGATGAPVRAPSLLSHLPYEEWPRGSEALADARGADPPVAHVTAVGAHLGPDADVWTRVGRRLTGFSWTSGAWIRAGSRVLASFF